MSSIGYETHGVGALDPDNYVGAVYKPSARHNKSADCDDLDDDAEESE